MSVSPSAFVLAGHGRRLGAALLDGVLGSAIASAGAAVGFGVGLIGAGSDDSDGWEALGWVLAGTLLGFVAGAAVWVALTVWLVQRPGARNGQTVGKQCFGIRAARVDGDAIGVGWGLVREIVAKGMLLAFTSSVVSALFGFFDGGLVGALVAVAVWYGPAFADDERRALHDRLCSTRVVVAPRAGDPATPPPAGDDLWPAPV